eukprot:809544-Prorocentrum_minimum.AAC.1
MSDAAATDRPSLFHFPSLLSFDTSPYGPSPVDCSPGGPMPKRWETTPGLASEYVFRESRIDYGPCDRPHWPVPGRPTSQLLESHIDYRLHRSFQG